MRFLSPIIIALTFLVVCIGPGPAQKNDDADKKQRRVELQKEIHELQEKVAELSAELAKLSTIIEIPRPNSKTYTTEEASALLPKSMARSRAINSQNPLVAEWKNPTHGFRVHVKANNDIETVNFFGEKQAGMSGLKSALQLSEGMQFGNPLSVLLTSDKDGWQTDTKQQILKTLFRPSIQLYIVTDK
ncbi:MAG: bZIP transcription factor [Planctomycetes bacterium]|nr:bZIP transcription factor [Planctomycetota bacterium]